ncbi:hypothetical protein MKW98_013168 [Papaver atlanticum]|uniref:TLDc domain-containing protein n=1 Tax=Papaver atlanticum TaxID=357466 RepID=A0AAD4T623_9MAGN|nr:hypothetical protein MKW98_013168 [Papaver atlanticum]
MGASSSSEQDEITEEEELEQQELESFAASTGALSILQKSFSNLSDPDTNSIPIPSLQECFRLTFENTPSKMKSPLPECFSRLLTHLGPAVVDLFFIADENGGVHWIEFLRGYIRCCGRMSLSVSLNTVYKLYAGISAKAGAPSKLEFESKDDDSKTSGNFTSDDVFMLLWMCWIMSWTSEISKHSKHPMDVDLPNINHLILSAVTSCVEISSDVDVGKVNISDLNVQLPAEKLHAWALTTVPNLAHCFTQYVHDRLQRCTVTEEPHRSSISIVESSSTESHNPCLLTSGKAWAISLTLTSTVNKEILKTCVPKDSVGVFENLLYRSSVHGKVMNRFWSSVDGYHGALLVLISACSIESCEGDSNPGRWIIGVLTDQGFENKDVFYGSSGYLYALSPIFHVCSPTGRDKNFIYSHLQPAGRGVYEPHPKPVGVAFGGTPGNERIFINQDFSTMTIRYHAVDKTYRPGSLFPNQGVLTYEASILEVEVWGLGGEKVKEQQDAYRKREELFTEQRRKVDLKTFGAWEDSPERMMMDMVSDPNKVNREDR